MKKREEEGTFMVWVIIWVVCAAVMVAAEEVIFDGSGKIIEAMKSSRGRRGRIKETK